MLGSDECDLATRICICYIFIFSIVTGCLHGNVILCMAMINEYVVTMASGSVVNHNAVSLKYGILDVQMLGAGAFG
jgi:hypothetical protein